MKSFFHIRKNWMLHGLFWVLLASMLGAIRAYRESMDTTNEIEGVTAK